MGGVGVNGIPSVANHVQVAIELRPKMLKVKNFGDVVVSRVVDEEGTMVQGCREETMEMWRP